MKIKYFLLLFLPLVVLSSCRESDSLTNLEKKEITEEIAQLMKNQEKCWNTGNLDCFMLPYLHSDSLMFIGKNGITYGWQQTLDNYKKGYPDTESMGKLQFDNIKVLPLSSVDCYVIGKWHLTRTIGDLAGHYTLLWHKNNKKGWQIIADHSS